jgi:predicted transcriptional regulator
MVKQMEGHSTSDILQSISDLLSADLFYSIAKGEAEVDTLKRTKGLTMKQFYSRTRQMSSVGLIKRNKGRFSLTTFGVVVFHAQEKIRSGIKNYWKLKAIDSIRSANEMNEEERVNIIKKIIGDERIEGIIENPSLKPR